MSWERSGAPESSFRFDDFIHHGMKRHAKDGAKLVAKLSEAWTLLNRNPSGFDCWCAPDREACDERITCSKDPIQVRA